MRRGSAERDQTEKQKDAGNLANAAAGVVAGRPAQVVAPLLAEATRAAYLAKTPVR